MTVEGLPAYTPRGIVPSLVVPARLRSLRSPRHMRVVLSFVAFGILLGGCASSKESLQRETARNIGGNTLPEAVTVSNVNRGAMSVTWDAQTPNGSYSCSADDMVRRTHCVKK